MIGFLNLNKPEGMTSRDAVNIVCRRLKTKAVGHAGTLDPMATGVLVVAVGKATRLVEYVQAGRKVYHAEFELGKSSDTDDRTGQVVERELTDEQIPTREQIDQLLPTFMGDISQIPPDYSAVHVAGQRAYDLARQGKKLELTARTVKVYCCEITSYSFPTLTLTIECGQGTYIRSIGRDLGNLLGTGAVMTRLERTQVGSFLINDAIDPDAATVEHLQAIEAGVVELARLVLSDSESARFQQGQKIPLVQLSCHPSDADLDVIGDKDIAVFSESNQLVGIGKLEDRRLRAVKCGLRSD